MSLSLGQASAPVKHRSWGFCGFYSSVQNPRNIVSLSFWKEAKTSASLLFGPKNGVFGSSMGHILDYFRPDFHPNDHDTTAYLAYYKEKLLHPETGVLTPYFVKEFTPPVRSAA